MAEHKKSSKASSLVLSAGGKILSSPNTPASDLERQIEVTLNELQNVADFSSLKGLFIRSAAEVQVADGKSAVVISVPLKFLPAFRKIQSRLVHELEKKFSGKHVVIVATRTVKAGPRSGKNSIAYNNSQYLDDVVYPAEVSGRRIRYLTDSTKFEKIYLDGKDKQQFEEKLETFSATYKQLTGLAAVFTFASQSARE